MHRMAGNKIINGFHGTNFDNVESIINNGFVMNTSSKDWLGIGIYFFVDGLGDVPQEHAAEWAKAVAWDKIKKRHTYERYAVIRASIDCSDNEIVLDMTTKEDTDFFNEIRKKYLRQETNRNRIRKSNPKPTDKEKRKQWRPTNLDITLLKILRRRYGYKICIANMFIKISSEERRNGSNTTQSFPNCTICAVYDMSKILEKESCKEGDIKKNEL